MVTIEPADARKLRDDAAAIDRAIKDLDTRLSSARLNPAVRDGFVRLQRLAKDHRLHSKEVLS